MDAFRRFTDRSAPRGETPQAGSASPSQDGPGAPLWLAASGLAAGVGCAALAAETDGGFSGVLLLTAAAAAGGLGLFGLVERASRVRRAAPFSPRDSFAVWFETAPEAAALVDRSGRLRAVNAAARRWAASCGGAPLTAADLLTGASEPERLVFSALSEVFDPEAPSPRVEASLSDGRRLQATRLADVGGVSQSETELALFRVFPSAEADASRSPSVEVAAPRTAGAGDSSSCEALGTPQAVAPPGDAPRGDGLVSEAGAAWFTVGPTGRIDAVSPLFDRWMGARAGRRPSLQALFPDLVRSADVEGGVEPSVATPTRLIGASGAPRQVAVLIGPETRGAVRVGLALPLGARALQGAAATASAAAPLSLGGHAAAHDRSDAQPSALLEAFDALPAERLFAEAAIGVLALSKEGRILRINAAADRLLTDGAPSDATLAGPVGDFLIDWIAEEDREVAESRIAAAAGGGDIAFEARMAGAGDGGRLTQCFLSAVDGDAGRVLLCHMIDVAEQRGLGQKFIQSQKLQAVGQLAGGVAHDFNNLLTVIIGSADARLKRMAENEPGYADLNAIRQSGRRAAWLVGQLLAFSRKQKLSPQRVDLTDRCSELVFLLTRMIGEKFEIETDFEEPLWPVEIDVNQFEQVITNLVMNATQAMSGGGAVRLTTRNATVSEPREQANFAMPPGDYVRIAVEDQGAGIPRDVLAKIFEPFFTTKPVGKGTGLGLAVVYGVVKQSDGFVFVDSQEGVGTVFEIFLPRVPEARSAIGETRNLAPTPTPTPALTPSPGAAPRRVGDRAFDPARTEDGPGAAGGGFLRGGAAPAGGGLSPAARAAAERLRSRKAPPPPSPHAFSGAASVSRTERMPAPSSAPQQGARILLVEDQEAVRVFAARNLEEAGFEVVQASGVAEASALLENPSFNVDLLLSDVVLEDGDGPSLVRALGDARPELRIVFMSGYQRGAFDETLDSASASVRETGFLQKPFTLDQLLAAMAEALSGPDVGASRGGGTCP